MFCVGLLVFLSLWVAAKESLLGREPSWKTHVHGGGAFSIEYPSEWHIDMEEDGATSRTMLSRSERVYMVVWRTPVAWQGARRPTDAAAQEAMTRELRRATESMWREAFDSYRPGRWSDTALGGRRATWSKFEAQSGSREMTGYQATVRDGDYVLLILAAAPTSTWEDFKPIAGRMLGSLRCGVDSETVGGG